MAVRKPKIHRNVLPIVLVSIGLLIGITYWIGSMALQAEKKVLVAQEQVMPQVRTPLLRVAPEKAENGAEAMPLKSRIQEINAQISDITELIKPTVSLLMTVGGLVLLIINLLKSRKEKKTENLVETKPVKRRAIKKD
jgi:cell division protein FtsB